MDNMHKVQANVKQDGMKFIVTFSYDGDIWKWHSKNHRKGRVADEMLELVKDNEVKEFYYEHQMNKFLKRFEKIIK